MTRTWTASAPNPTASDFDLSNVEDLIIFLTQKSTFLIEMIATFDCKFSKLFHIKAKVPMYQKRFARLFRTVIFRESFPEKYAADAAKLVNRPCQFLKGGKRIPVSEDLMQKVTSHFQYSKISNSFSFFY